MGQEMIALRLQHSEQGREHDEVVGREPASPTAFGGHTNGAAGFASMLRTAQLLPRWGS